MQLFYKLIAVKQPEHDKREFQQFFPQPDSDSLKERKWYIDLAKPKSGALVSVFSLITIKTVIKLFSTGCRRVSSRGSWDQSGGWAGKGRIGEVWTCDKTHASQRYPQAAEDLRCCSWWFEQIFEDRESFYLQRKSAMSASVEIIFFWAWMIILVWENEPKLKGTTVNYFEFRHHQSIDQRVYTW